MNSLSDHSFQAEQSVLGAVLLDADVLDEISFLEERDFSPSHAEILKVMRYLDEQNKPVDLVTVTTEYNHFRRLDQIGGIDYLVKLVDACPTTANVKHYAKIVRSKAIRKRGSDIGNQIAELAHADFKTDEEYFSAAEVLLDKMRPQEVGKMQSFKETKERYLKHLKQKVSTILSGMKSFDTWSKGLGRQELFVSAGRPSMGKTALLMQRVRGIAEHNPSAGCILVYSQEMADNELKDRMISNMTGIPFARIKSKALSEKEEAAVLKAYEQLEQYLIFIQDSAGVTIQEIRSTARQFKRKYGRIAMIAVDYLQIMSIPQAKNESRAQAIGNVTTTAKRIAREMDCNFMMLSQMSRESENKKKPQLSDLKESSNIEQDADVVEFLWHDSGDTHQNGKVVQQFIAKGRNIGINEFRLLFRGWKQHFEELEDE
ncbi:DnaB-like helicase C-terminal domain-containing protein [Alkalihalophilus lindianensis]|uniref:DNA 5'-3' helicase n=1 Tax=Alkalihalophilus lindianensis TaxID=1630542 RepID=A0ABU3X795_9BACI|nr:DnaB-like helicase C-terminal domain-containing protein [Alkalihalophilus lindianensis]MDV2683765.1 DnaB-like helicase C-terminal domain-containing protein [Alkalihalophilus lindianensis]MDV2683831.1 DnaB-like helicase C-terminal domain-containing protein [Alkalihalophilus lindianensis]